MRRNPKKSYSFNSDLEGEGEDGNNWNASSESDDENYRFEEVTKIFTSKLSGLCELESCNEPFIAHLTKIMGVKIASRPKYNGKPYWICAKHSRFYTVPDEADEDIEEEEDLEEDPEEDSEEDSEEDPLEDSEDSDTDTDDNDESKDESKTKNYKKEMADIKMMLSRSRPEDKMNTERYKAERGKYQLEIHTPTNPGLHLSEEKRLKRANRETGRDLGLNQERNIETGDLENQRWADVFVRGERVRVFPDLRRMSHYNTTCPACGAQIVRNSWVVPAQLRWRGKLESNSRQKAFYICASHANQQESDSD